MMTGAQRAKAKRLRAAIAATAATKDGAPRDVRQEAITLRKEVQQEGTTACTLAAALGVHPTTLYRWEREEGAQESSALDVFQRVQVVASAEPRALPPAEASMVPVMSARAASPKLRGEGASGLRVVHVPSGLMIEGLDIEALVVLLRRMT